MKTYSVTCLCPPSEGFTALEIEGRFTALEIARMEAFSAEERLLFLLRSDAIPNRDLRYLCISFAERVLEYAYNPKIREFICMAVRWPHRARDEATEYLASLNDKGVDPDHLYIWNEIAHSFVAEHMREFCHIIALDLMTAAAECTTSSRSAYVQAYRQLEEQFLELAILTLRRVER